MPQTEVRIVLARSSRDTLARLDGTSAETVRAAFLRVGDTLLAQAEQVTVDPGWSRRTLSGRRYPQQCYAQTIRFLLQHPEITQARLVHGVASHAPRHLPFEHAWVELPGEVIFDGVVQAFFTRESYRSVMAAVSLDSYSCQQARTLLAKHSHPGPWSLHWVPTPEQFASYLAAVRQQMVMPGVGLPPA